MGQDFINGDLSENGISVDDPLKNEKNERENKCNQCNYASSRTGDLRRHLKTHSGEKLNKCNQFDNVSFEGPLEEAFQNAQ